MANASRPPEIPLFLMVTFTGIMTSNPMRPRVTKMFRSILVNRKKMIASSPILSTSTFSFVLKTGPIHEKRPLPIGGGACCSSACFVLGAYTRVCLGRTKQNNSARSVEMPTEVASEAQKALTWKADWNGFDTSLSSWSFVLDPESDELLCRVNKAPVSYRASMMPWRSYNPAR